jgi:hypothetical protein
VTPGRRKQVRNPRSKEEVAWARAVEVLVGYQDRGIMTLTTTHMINLLSLDERRASSAVQQAQERLAPEPDRDPLTGARWAGPPGSHPPQTGKRQVPVSETGTWRGVPA